MDEKVQLALQNCKNLSDVDKTELGLLKSRVEEQSHLIMILKSRADDEYSRRKTFENIVEQLQQSVDEVEDNLKQEKSKFTMLEQKFDILASNHQEMIGIKEEYKRENERLREKNENLCQENEYLKCNRSTEKAAAVSVLKATIERLKKDADATAAQIKLVTKQMEENESKFLQEKQSFERQITSLNQALDVSLKEVADSTRAVEEEREKYNVSLADLRKDKEKYMTLARDRGQLVEEKVGENRKLQEKLSVVEKELHEAKERFEREAIRLDKDLLVRDLRKRAEESESKLEQFKKEYSAFVSERNNRLNKEIQLNKHLKQLLNA